MFFEQMFSPDYKKDLGQIDALIKKYYLSRKKCEAQGFISDCCGKVISSHSISKKFLREIASNDGHVYCFDDRIFGLVERNGEMGLKRVGISDASTYNMFCSQHDNSLFSPIEDCELIPDENQCLRLMYRALMMEKHHKESQFYFWNYMVENAKSPFEFLLSSPMLECSKIALRETDLIKEKISYAVKTNDVSNLRVLRIYYREEPGVLCSGAFFPEYDYRGTSLWKKYSLKTTLDALSINILPLSNDGQNYNGVAVLSWLDNPGQDYCQKFIESMHEITLPDLSNVLIHTIFEYIENICISPSWWDSKEKSIQNTLLGLHAIQKHSPLKYKEITMQYDNWNAAEAQLWNGKNWDSFPFS